MRARELTHPDDLVEGDCYTVTSKVNGRVREWSGSFIRMGLSWKSGDLVLTFVNNSGKMRALRARNFCSAVKEEGL